MGSCNSWTCIAVQAGLIGAAALTLGLIDRTVRPIKMELAEPPPVVVPQPALTPAPSATTPTPTSPNQAANPAPVAPPAPRPAPTQPQTAPKANDPASKLFISLEQLQVLIQQGVQLVDARESHEFATGRLPGAVNLPPGGFNGPQASVVDNLLRDLPVVVYCGGGECDASKLVALKLQDRGYTLLYIYHDGFAGWTKAGMPVEK